MNPARWLPPWTASRLATVQREIDNLATRLTADPENRAALLREQIDALQKELHDVELDRLK